jgi:HAD superfamily hydrolase (TIGR01490 family)
VARALRWQLNSPARHDDDQAAGGSAGTPAAFFDVDGTLLSVQSGLLYIKSLRRGGLMSLTDVLRIYWGFVTYKLGVMNIARVAEVTSRWLVGRTEQSILDHAEGWYRDEVRRHLRSDIVRKVEEHREAGNALALLTSGTRYLTDFLRDDLQIEHALATKVEVVDGCFTGKGIMPFCYGSGKVFWAEKFADEQGIDLAQSYFYTDSIVDLPMMERVGYPVAVYPDARLRREAKRRGWPIIDARSLGASDDAPRSAP